MEAEEELGIEDVDQLVDAIGRMVDDTGAERVVIDSITAVAQALDDTHLIRSFIFRMSALLDSKDVTVLMTSEAPPDRYSRYGVEEFIADGIIHLTHEVIADQERRGLRIVKMRGTDYQSGVHHFTITDAGIDLFQYEMTLDYPGSAEKYPTGVPGLDPLLDGGLLAGTSTLITGPSGSGKTMMGWHIIREQLEQGRRCLVVSFEESHGQLLQNTKRLGWDMQEYVDEGSLILHTVRPESAYPEEHLATVLDMLEEENIDCLLLDSLSVIHEMYPDSVFKSFARNTLFSVKARNITGLFTFATEDTGVSLQGHGPYINTIADNIISLANVEIQGGMRHTLSIVKTRGSSHSKKIHQYDITGKGIRIGTDMSAYRGITTGAAEKVGKTTKERLEDAYAHFLGPLGRQEFQALPHTDRDTVMANIEELAENGILDEDSRDAFQEGVQAIFAGESWDFPHEQPEQHESLLQRLLRGGGDG